MGLIQGIDEVALNVRDILVSPSGAVNALIKGAQIRETQVGADAARSWGLNAAANSAQVLAVSKPSVAVSEYKLIVCNPSSQTALTVRVYARSLTLGGCDRLTLLTSFGAPAAASAIAAWAASTAYSQNDLRRPLSVLNGHNYKCTTAGTSGGSQPTWPTDGSSVNDGTAVWADQGIDYSGATSHSRLLHGLFTGADLALVVTNDTGGTLAAFDAAVRIREVG
jgi:hypothetical protein